MVRIHYMVTGAVMASLLVGCTNPIEESVRQQMKDPDAVQFRGVERCGDRAGTVWRGEANGKNSYGAYEGFERFYYENGSVEFLHNGPGRLFNKCLDQTKAYTRQLENQNGRQR